MIVQFFSRGKGRGAGPIDYLLGRQRDRPLATLLRGDADETEALINSSLYAKKYTSGCLSFEEGNIDDAQKQALMDSFETCLFAGLDFDQYNCLWVEHLDKGRLELNFVIPNIELTTGKRLQPYYHAADTKRVDAWRTIQNLTYGFSDPDDPFKRQLVSKAKDLPKDTRQAVDAITAGLYGLVSSERVRCREDVVTALQSIGLEIARLTPSSISIKNPEGGRNIRLKGVLYEQTFRFGDGFRGELEAAAQEFQRGLKNRLARARDLYQKQLDGKRSEHQRRHGKPERTVAAAERSLDADVSDYFDTTQSATGGDGTSVHSTEYSVQGEDKAIREELVSASSKAAAVGGNRRLDGGVFDDGRNRVVAGDGQEREASSLDTGTDTGIAAAAKEYPWDTDHQLSVGQWWHSALRGSRSDSASMGQEWRVPSDITEKGLSDESHRNDVAGSADALWHAQRRSECQTHDLIEELAAGPRPPRHSLSQRIRRNGQGFQANADGFGRLAKRNDGFRAEIDRSQRAVDAGTEALNEQQPRIAEQSRYLDDGVQWSKQQDRELGQRITEFKALAADIERQQSDFEQEQPRFEAATRGFAQRIGQLNAGIEHLQNLRRERERQAEVVKALEAAKPAPQQSNDDDYGFRM